MRQPLQEYCPSCGVADEALQWITAMGRTLGVGLKVEPMTEETFGPYGVLMDAKERPKDPRAFFPIDFQVDGRTTLNVIWQPRQVFASPGWSVTSA